jgi:hypothetical protein
MSALAAIQEDVYTFDQLSDEAKRRARDARREDEARDFEPEYESYETAAKLLGIDLTERLTNKRTGKSYTANTIQYSGFWSQGDGASFTGDFTFVPGCCESVREMFPQCSILHEIADSLTAMHNTLRLLEGKKLSGKITHGYHSGSYVHSHTMDATAYDEEGEELEIETSDRFRDIMRDFADWIYKGLEEDYDSQTSDEAINERLSEGDYEFDEEGVML